MAQANHAPGKKNNQQFPRLSREKPSIQAVMEVVLYDERSNAHAT